MTADLFINTNLRHLSVKIIHAIFDSALTGMVKKALNILLFSIIMLPCIAQTGGDNVYEFLNLTHSGLVSSLGGTNVSLQYDNLNLAYHNPALLTASMNKSLH